MPSWAECVMLIEDSSGEDITAWMAGDFSPCRIPAPMTCTYSTIDSCFRRLLLLL